jgi:arylsulfatase A-like enzyme
LFEGLRREARDHETIIVITSDHGELLGERHRRGHPGSLDEEVTRIPLFIRAADLEPGTNSAIVQLTDVFGYLADKAGLDPATDSDAVPFGSRREAVIEQRPDAQTPTPPGYPRGDVSALVQWPYKYVEGPQEGAALFDLSLNQEEHVNLLTRDPTRAAAMSARLRVLSPTSSSSGTESRPDAAIRERLRALGYIR